MGNDEKQEITNICNITKELDKKLTELQVTYEDRTSTQIDKLSDNNTKNCKELLQLIKQTNNLDITIENRKLLKLITENMEFIKKDTFVGHIPE